MSHDLFQGHFKVEYFVVVCPSLYVFSCGKPMQFANVSTALVWPFQLRSLPPNLSQFENFDGAHFHKDSIFSQ